MLLNPEIGLLAALLLLFNDDYARSHGVLTGTFDTGLTLACLGWHNPVFPLVAAAKRTGRHGSRLASSRDWHRSSNRRSGLLPILLLAIHAIAVNRTHKIRGRLLLPLMSLAAAGLSSAGGGTSQNIIDGGRDIHALHETTIQRISEGLSPHHVKAATYYLGRISQSSFAFALVRSRGDLCPDPGNSSWSTSRNVYPHLAVSFGWLVLFSVSASKCPYSIMRFSVSFDGDFHRDDASVALFDWLRPSRGRSGGQRCYGFCIPVLVIADASQLAVGMYSDTKRFFGPWAATQLFPPRD